MPNTFNWPTLTAAVGLLALTACGSPVPNLSATAQSSGTGFSTQWYGGGGGYSGWGGYGGFGNYGYGYGTCGLPGGCGPAGFGNVPVSGDIFGGTTFFNTDNGRFDRQPASLPYGVAEENDEAYRPLGSAIWQKK